MSKGTWAVVSTIRAPEFMVNFFINHYRNLNADEIHIFMDDPNNADVDEALLEDPRVNIYVCDDVFWKKRESKYPLMIEGRPDNVEGRQFSNYLAIQETSSVEWILNVDADEILISDFSISEILKNTPRNVFMLGARTLEAVYQDFPLLEDIYDACFFKNTYTKHSAFVEDNFSKELNANEHGFWAHRHGKGFFRRQDKIKKLSCHYPLPLNDSLLSKFQHKDLELLHFECMTFELFHEKRLNRITKKFNTTRISKVDRERLDFFKKVYEEYGASGTKKLYKEMNIFSGDRLEKALSVGFLVQKNISSPALRDCAEQVLFSYHKTLLVVNNVTGLVEAKSENNITDTDVLVYVESELPSSGKAYLYCVMDEVKQYIFPGERGELVLYGYTSAFFYNYKKMGNKLSIAIADTKGGEKFLSVKPNGSVGFYAAICKEWELFSRLQM